MVWHANRFLKVLMISPPPQLLQTDWGANFQPTWELGNFPRPVTQDQLPPFAWAPAPSTQAEDPSLGPLSF